MTSPRHTPESKIGPTDPLVVKKISNEWLCSAVLTELNSKTLWAVLSGRVVGKFFDFQIILNWLQTFHKSMRLDLFKIERVALQMLRHVAWMPKYYI